MPQVTAVNQPQYPPPQSNNGNALKIILIVLGVFLVVCCGGAGITAYVLYQGAVMAANAAQEVITTTMTQIGKDAIASSKEAQDAIGEVQSFAFNFTESSNGNMRGEIKGSKGSGTITFSGGDNNPTELRMSDGRVFPLKKVEDYSSDIKLPETETTDESSGTEPPAEPTTP